MRYQDAVDAVQSPNREHNLRFTYESDGFIAERRVVQNENDQWQVGIFIDNLSRTQVRENTAVTPPPFEKGYLQIDQADQRVALGINPTVTIQYYNSPEGMRQNFLVPQPPEGNGDLELALNVLTLNAAMDPGSPENEMRFLDAYNKEQIMTYSDLNVFDADNQRLPATMKTRGANTIVITVDDSSARYPLLIDPLSQSSQAGVSGSSGSSFGEVVIMIPDVGYAIGAPMYDGGQTDEGAVFAFDTDETDTDVNIITPAFWNDESDQTGARFGSALTTGYFKYDNNGADLAIGAPYFDSGSNYNAGKVYVYYYDNSSSTYSSSPDWTKVEVNQQYTLFGASLTTGNFDADLYDSLVVGAPEYDSNGVWDYDNGGVWAYEGSSGGLSSTAHWSKSGQNEKDRFGRSLTVGNVNGDGYVDLAIGAPGYGYDSYYGLYDRQKGAVYVYHGGSSSLNSTHSTLLTCSQNGAWFGLGLGGRRSTYTGGSAQTSMWDVDDDGYDDIIVGAPYYDNGQTNEGRVYVYYGTSSGLSTSAGWQAEINQAGAYFGFSVTGLPDLDGDGYPEIAVGAPYHDYFHTNNGRVYIWCGSSSGVNGGTNGNEYNMDAHITNYAGSNQYAGKSLDAIDFDSNQGIIVGNPGGNDATLIGF